MCIRTYSPVPPVNSCGNARDRSLLPSPRTSITCSKINGTKPPPGRCSRGRLQTLEPHHKQGACLAPQQVPHASRHETSNGLEAQRQWNRDTSGAAAGDNAMGGGGALLYTRQSSYDTRTTQQINPSVGNTKCSGPPDDASYKDRTTSCRT
jgi:hypothetical protein